MNKTLLQIWEDMPVKSDKGDIHSYLPVYEQILAPYRYTAKNILEVGIFQGASLQMWEAYFSGKVHGIDCSETPHDGLADLRPLIKEKTHNIYIGDATNKDDLDRFFPGVKFKIVVDDGNHNTISQIETFNHLKGKMEKGGIYIVEDAADIDNDREKYLALHPNVEILDLRSEKNRFDDVLILIRF